MSEDGNGMTEWDKFDNWAEKKLGLDIMGKFKTDDYDWTGADTARKEQDDWEAEHGEEERFMEGSGEENLKEWQVLDKIANLLMPTKGFYGKEYGENNDLFFEYNDVPYRITLEEIEDYRSRDNNDEDLPWTPKRR